MKLQSVAFFVTWVLFLIVAIIKAIMTDVAMGLQYTLLLWCTLVIFTPIPEGGILVSYPLQEFTGLHMVISQSLVFVVSSIVLVFHYHGKFASGSSNLLLDFTNSQKKILIVALFSVISTFAITIVIHEALNNKQPEIIITATFIGVLFSVLWVLYIYRMGYRSKLLVLIKRYIDLSIFKIINFFKI